MSTGWRKKQIMMEEQRSEQQSQVEEMLRYEIDALEEKLAECRAQREWRELTDEEFFEVWNNSNLGPIGIKTALEAKLKAKNFAEEKNTNA